jgi:hypothetical protein
MDNIMYCNQTKQYVGWKKGQDELFVSTYTFTNTHFYLFVNYILWCPIMCATFWVTCCDVLLCVLRSEVHVDVVHIIGLYNM